MYRNLLQCLWFVVAGASVGGCRTIADHEVERGRVPLPAELPSRPSERAGKEWREWRGPTRDGVAEGVAFPAKLPRGTWPENWRVPVGDGISGVVVREGRVYCHARQGRLEVVTCHDAATGAVVWSHRTALEDAFSQPWFAFGITDGPLATPAIEAGRIYTVGINGRVECLDARSGDPIFSLTPEAVSGAPSEPEHGHASSPLVRDGRLFISWRAETGPQLLALDARDGKILWRSVDENITYTSLVPATILDTSQLIVRTWRRVLGVLADSGEIIWELEAVTGRYDRDCTTPVVVGNLVYTTNNLHGTRALQVRKEGSSWRADPLWRSGGLAGGTATPVYHDGHLYGLHRKGGFVCLDARTGRRKWIARAFGSHLSLILLGDKALCLDEKGTLAIVELTPKEYRELGRWQIGTYTWAHPGIDSERFYYRDGTDLVCLSLEAGARDAPDATIDGGVSARGLRKIASLPRRAGEVFERPSGAPGGVENLPDTRIAGPAEPAGPLENRQVRPQVGFGGFRARPGAPGSSRSRRDDEAIQRRVSSRRSNEEIGEPGAPRRAGEVFERPSGAPGGVENLPDTRIAGPAEPAGPLENRQARPKETSTDGSSR